MRTMSQNLTNANDKLFGRVVSNNNKVGEESDNGFAADGRLMIDLSAVTSSSPTPTNGHYQLHNNPRLVHQYAFDNDLNPTTIDINVLQQQLLALQQQVRGQSGQGGNAQQQISISRQQQQQLLIARALVASPYVAPLQQQLYFSLNNLILQQQSTDNALQQQLQLSRQMPGGGGAVATNYSSSANQTDCSTSRNTPHSSMASPGASRPTSTVVNAEVLEQHISHLISNNDAVLESVPMISKRRSYTRQHHAGGSLDYATMTAGQQPHRSLTTGRGCRSQSLIETGSPPVTCLFLPQNSTPFPHNQSISNASSSSNVNQALTFHAQVESATLEAMDKLYNCKFCHLGVRHLDELKRHEDKCGHREDTASCSKISEDNIRSVGCEKPATTTVIALAVINQPHLSVNENNKRITVASPNVENKHPLKKRILAAEFAQKPQQLLIKEESAKLVTIVPSSAQTPNCEIPITTVTCVINRQNDAQNVLPIHIAKNCAVTPAPDCGMKFVATEAYLEVIPKVTLSASEQLGIFRPYCVTVKIHGATSLEPTKCGRKLHQVTQTTHSSSLHRLLPCLDWQISEYTRCWQQNTVTSPLASKLNIMYMDGCMMKRHLPYLRYTVADKDLNLMRVTHSSYWTYSKKRFPYSSTTVTSAECVNKKISPGATTIIVGNSSSDINNTTTASVEDRNSTVLQQQTSSTPHSQAGVFVKDIVKEYVCDAKSSVTSNFAPVSSTTSAVVRNNSCSNICAASSAAANSTSVYNTSSTTTISTSLYNNATSTVSSFSKELLKSVLTSGVHLYPKKVAVCSGGYKTNEAYTYVRGRGRGRYVCARCGIRCKKPSMLKKHIRTHLNVRPYSCGQCMFSFKTKGNLTKHLKSKAHSKKCAQLQSNEDGTDMKVDQNSSSDILEDSDETLSEDELDNMSDDEMETIAQEIWQHGSNPTDELRERICSFKNVWNRVRTGMYFGRQVRTPPLDIIRTIDIDDFICDRCDSAPPCVTLDAASVDMSPTTFFQYPCASTIYSNSNGKNAFASCFENCEPSTSFASPSKQYKLLSVIPNSVSITDLDTQAATATSPSKINNYLNCLTAEGKPKCEICGAEFTKFSLLRLHMDTHVLEQSTRRQSDKCPFCNSSFRSKNVLQKHLIQAHPHQCQQNQLNAVVNEKSGVVSDASANINSDSNFVTSNTCSLKQTNVISPSSSNNKPRPFECRDCEKSFRIHGHLAKHLRSKSHIMQLECLDKLPSGTFAKLEELNCDLTKIDVSDSENSLKDLLKIAEKIMASSSSTTTSTKHEINDDLDDSFVDVVNNTTSRDSGTCESKIIQAISTATVTPNGKSVSGVATVICGGTVSSLTCTEELRPSPPVTPSCVKKQNERIVSTGRTIIADVWNPPKSEKISADTPTGHVSKVSVVNATFAKPTQITSHSFSKIINDVALPANSIISANVNNADFKAKSDSSALCNICNTEYPSSIELEIHLHADHVFMRDGRNFKCPKANCETVYPTKRDLRNHLTSHYYGTLDNDISPLICPNNDVISKSTAVALNRKLTSNNNTNSGNFSIAISGTGTIDLSPSDNYSKRLFDKNKTHVVKLKFGGSTETVQSADSSPVSDSDVSRASFSSQSVSPAQNSSLERHFLKRHSSEDCVSLVPPKRSLVDDDNQHRHAAFFKESLDAAMARNVTPSSGIMPNIYQQQPPGNSAPVPSPLAVPVPVVAQRPQPPPQMLWPSFINGGASSPQAMFLTAAAIPMQNAAAALLNFSSHQALLAAAMQQQQQQQQQNAAKMFGVGGCWPPQTYAYNPANMPQFFTQQLGQQAAAAFGAAPSAAAFDAPVPFLMDQLRCMICQTQCLSLMALQEHLMSHAQPRSHVCNFCDAAFTTAQALQAHKPCRLQKT